MSDFDECRECGSAVLNMNKHRVWHRKLTESVEAAQDTADTAQQTADEAANVLYQNNISI